MVDFGDLQIFEGVTTYPAILTLRRVNGHAGSDDLRFLKSYDMARRSFEGIRDCFPFHAARATGRQRLEVRNQRLNEIWTKMAGGRKTVAEAYGSSLYGIKTGLNDAFIVSREARDALIARDGRSAALL